jgi:hypothetical protein
MENPQNSTKQILENQENPQTILENPWKIRENHKKSTKKSNMCRSM